MKEMVGARKVVVSGIVVVGGMVVVKMVVGEIMVVVEGGIDVEVFGAWVESGICCS